MNFSIRLFGAYPILNVNLSPFLRRHPAAHCSAVTTCQGPPCKLHSRMRLIWFHAIAWQEVTANSFHKKRLHPGPKHTTQFSQAIQNLRYMWMLHQQFLRTQIPLSFHSHKSLAIICTVSTKQKVSALASKHFVQQTAALSQEHLHYHRYWTFFLNISKDSLSWSTIGSLVCQPSVCVLLLLGIKSSTAHSNHCSLRYPIRKTHVTVTKTPVSL